jgi:hypothetical protein
MKREEYERYFTIPVMMIKEKEEKKEKNYA